jgi:hypothetical protein
VTNLKNTDFTEDLQNSSLQFKRGANQVRKEMWWKDMKLKLIIGGIVVVILIIIIGMSNIHHLYPSQIRSNPSLFLLL